MRLERAAQGESEGRKGVGCHCDVLCCSAKLSYSTGHLITAAHVPASMLGYEAHKSEESLVLQVC